MRCRVRIIERIDDLLNHSKQVLVDTRTCGDH